MKTTLLLISIFLFSTYTPSRCSVAEAPKPVLDAAGKKLRADTLYYILPAKVQGKGHGGGLTLDNIGKYNCLLAVVLEPYEYMDGSPLKFYPVNLKKGMIRVSTDLNVKFFGPNSCRESNVWKLEDFDPSIRKYLVGVDGVIGNLSVDTLSNWFKIEKWGNTYRLRYCPSICNKCNLICKDVGIVLRPTSVKKHS